MPELEPVFLVQIYFSDGAIYSQQVRGSVDDLTWWKDHEGNQFEEVDEHLTDWAAHGLETEALPLLTNIHNRVALVFSTRIQ